MNLIAQAFRSISSIIYRTSSPEGNSRVELKGGNLMMTRVTVNQPLQG